MGEYDDVGGVFELKVNGVLYNLKGQPTIELGGTYREPHGGEFTVVALAWLNWQLKGDMESAKLFKNGELKKRKDWTLESNGK